MKSRTRTRRTSERGTSTSTRAGPFSGARGEPPVGDQQPAITVLPLRRDVGVKVNEPLLAVIDQLADGRLDLLGKLLLKVGVEQLIYLLELSFGHGAITRSRPRATEPGRPVLLSATSTPQRIIPLPSPVSVGLLSRIHAKPGASPAGDVVFHPQKARAGAPAWAPRTVCRKGVARVSCGSCGKKAATKKKATKKKK